MSELYQLQVRFARLVPRLIDWIFANGYQTTGDEWWRSPAEARLNAASGTGIVNSLHPLKLAIDLNLFKDDVELQTVDDYRPVGEFWKTLDPLACWGGDFAKPDADHFSLTFQGVR